MNKIGIIGGGPAGMLAAGIAALQGNKVYLLEKNNRLGKKMYITGKGRCNITNGSPIEEFFDNIINNKEFMYSSLYSFTNEDIIGLLNKYNLPTKVERGNRIFPKSDKSSDVIKALSNFMEENKVEIKLNTQVEVIKKTNNNFTVKTNKGDFKFDKIVIATGGISYPLTGSTGDGYRFAEKFGHTIIKPRPSLIPIELNEKWLKELQGLSLKNVELKTFSQNKLIHKEFGEMIFTHFGISGPIVLTSSSHIYNYINKDIRFEIDLKPALDYEKLDNRILRDFSEQGNKQFKNSLNQILPQKLIPIVIEKSQIQADKLVNQITKGERENLLKSIKSFDLRYKSLRPIREAIITSGGINTREIDPSTMESKLVKNLYFAGEVIDVDALTGGYNLQIAYSTGYLSGISL